MNKLELIIPKSVDKIIKTAFITIESWANTLSGILYSQLTISSKEIPASKVNWPEWMIPLVLTGEDAYTASTSYVRCSGVFSWSSSYPTTGGSWYFEASLAIADAGQTVTAHLIGTSEVTNSAVSHTGDTALTPVRSSALTMPTSAANLYVEFKSSDVSCQANLASARLIFVPS